MPEVLAMRLPTYKNYLLAALTVISAFNFVDRAVLAISLQDIKTDLGLSDTQLGFLSGIAFALFYSVMGVPIARWADRGNRVLIIAATTAFWSVAVVLCGLTGNFSQLLLMRVGVAIGEAGCGPPAISLLADYFARDRRTWAMAMYSLGAPIAVFVGFSLAGWLNELYGWRTTFMLLGTPGVLMSLLAWFTLKEPRCATGALQVPELLRGLSSWKAVFEALWPQRTFRHLLVCLVINGFFGVGVLKWLPAFLARSHGLSSTEIGTGLAFAIGIGGIAGSYFGGMLASRYAVRDESRQLRGVAVTIALACLLSMLAYIVPSSFWTFVLMTLYMFCLYACNGPIFGTIQTLVPQHMRAVSFALIYLVTNLIGMGLGPLIAGMLSDTLMPWVGNESLRYTLLILTPAYLGCVWHVWRASSAVGRDMAAAQARDALPAGVASVDGNFERFTGTAHAMHKVASAAIRK